MVVIHCKKTEFNQFLYQTNAKISIEELANELTEANNLRIKIDKLAVAIEDLATHGPLRPEELRGLTMPETYEPACELLPEHKKKWAHPVPSPDQRINEDKTGYRTGIAQKEDVCQIMKQEANKAKTYISKGQVEKNVTMEIKILNEHVELMRGAVMIAYPGYHGIPLWEPVYEILENKMDFLATFPDCDWVEKSEATLWWAGKELLKGKLLCDYIGKNEKTKIIVKLQPKKAGAPVREPLIDQSTHKEMLAFYYKKQEEQKKLEENNDDYHYQQPWADPNSLKKQLHGQAFGHGVSWKPK